jgi:hypothetical protein
MALLYAFNAGKNDDGVTFKVNIRKKHKGRNLQQTKFNAENICPSKVQESNRSNNLNKMAIALLK